MSLYKLTNSNHKFSAFDCIQSEVSILDNYLTSELPSLSGPLAETVEYVTSKSGKKIRPNIVFLIYGLIGSNNSIDDVLRVAQITELIHSASLIHDDVIDDAQSRRGFESVSHKFGIKVAVILGDFLFSQASVKLGELSNPEIVKIYANVLAKLCEGEISQAKDRYRFDNLNWETYLNKSNFKTASLFEAACRATAIVNDLSQERIESISMYGAKLGLAFQLIDDLLDFVGNPAETGKPLMGDIAHGIYTAPILFCLEDKEKEKYLKELLSNLPITESAQKSIREVLEVSGSFDKTNDYTKKLVQSAIDSLSGFPDNVYKSSLIQLAEFTIQRAY
jgi:geranylgeranyl pyrophosphate synthase